MTYDWNNIWHEQEKLQYIILGQPIQDVNSAAYLRDNVVALTDELHEALRCNTWKPWSTQRFFDPDPTAEELIDALHFLVNLFLWCGWSADDVFNAYFKKHAVNIQRQADGY